MLGRIKYKLLCWLLGDICCGSDCHTCQLGHKTEIGGYEGIACQEEDVYIQARKVWGLEE